MRTKRPELIGQCTGQDLKGMFEEATRALERNAQAINHLNVFPVPDGDTGTNMLLTMKAAIEEARRSPDDSASAISKALARGALMGARGNSGVIMSQIMRGMAHALENKKTFSAKDLASALSEASTAAYKSVSRPVEGTMLTVIRETWEAVSDAASQEPEDVAALMEIAASSADDSVARTPSLLPVLRDAGVVDAGGQGLAVLIRGMLRHLKGQATPDGATPEVATVSKPVDWTAVASGKTYGYCTEFLLESKGLDREQVRKRLEKLGDSVMVVGDGISLRAHLHTADPGAALSYATSLGPLRQVKVENIDDQHRDFLAARVPKAQPAGGVSAVAVVSGEGLARVLESLGVNVLVPGGDTMNPSIKELLQAIDSAPADHVIVLPNDSNILPAAEQARTLAQKKVVVLPSRTVPQGIGAMLAFNYARDLKSNVQAMSKAILAIRTGQVALAVQTMHSGLLKVKKGQTVGFSELKPVVIGDNRSQVLLDLLEKMDVSKASLVTIYYGADTGQIEVDETMKLLHNRFPKVEFEVVFGGQPHYNYLVSVE